MWAVNQSGDASSEPLNIPLDIPSHHINGDIILIYIYIYLFIGWVIGFPAMGYNML